MQGSNDNIGRHFVDWLTSGPLMLLSRCQTGWHLHRTVLFLAHGVKCSFSLFGFPKRADLNSLWGKFRASTSGGRGRGKTVCQCSAYTPNVITCERDKEGQGFPIKLISHCKVLFPFNRFQGERLPWSLLSRWMGSSGVRPSSDACWFVFLTSLFLLGVKGVKCCHFVPWQSHSRQ